MVKVVNRYRIEAMLVQHALTEQPVILQQVAAGRTAHDSITVGPQTVLQHAETDVIHQDQAVPPYPGESGLQAGNLFHKTIQNLAVQRIVNKDEEFVTLAMELSTEPGAGKIIADDQNFHEFNVPPEFIRQKGLAPE
jgi:hypothetical protein